MKKIEEKISGGEKARSLFSEVYVDSFPAPGETYAKVKQTTYEAEFPFAYTVTVEEEIEPPKDKNGNPKRDRVSEKKKCWVSVILPFSIGEMKGQIKQHVYATSLEEIPQKILEALGNAVAEAENRRLAKE